MRLFNRFIVKSGVIVALLLSSLSPLALAEQAKAFVYTELQISAPFSQIPWQGINKAIKQQPGFMNKTWLSGAGNNSAGGFYAFASIEDAQRFVTEYFPAEAASFGVAQTTRVFDALATKGASRQMNSPFFGGKLKKKPAAYVYTEVQLSVKPFSEGPWKAINEKLQQQPGILAKTWLSGLHTGTPGGFYAFDTLENAQNFALNYFPGEAKSLNAAFYTRVFDASGTEQASVGMDSPFYQ
jgi:hypothetical protein